MFVLAGFPCNHKRDLSLGPATDFSGASAITWAQRLKRVFGLDIEICLGGLRWGSQDHAHSTRCARLRDVVAGRVEAAALVGVLQVVRDEIHGVTRPYEPL
jgi:hypothetical protein